MRNSLLTSPVWSPLSFGELAAVIIVRPSQRLTAPIQRVRIGRSMSQNRITRSLSLPLTAQWI
jgi:hypothetical protein